VLLVGAHMLGACLVWLGTLSVLWSLRERPADSPPPASAPAGREAKTAEPAPVP
jgi:cytochrome c oxidase assembly protein subunit 15